MALEARFRTIQGWPTWAKVTKGRKSAQFKVALTKTYDDLETELWSLRARDVIIETYHDPGDIRNDGWPRSSAKVPTQPGVILSFESKHGPLRYPCDTYRDWEHNLRAIALTMQALRHVDRWGASKGGEQYRGYAALPPPTQIGGNGHATMQPDDAVRLLGRVAKIPTDGLRMGRDDYRVLYLSAAKNAHPDSGGSESEFKGVVEAKRVLVEANWMEP